jgi:tetratricopeptide (TPR) repeat protein
VFVAIEREYFATAREAADLALTAGVSEQTLAAVHRAAQRGPLDEPLQARLVRMLAAAGHQADALDVYQQVRNRLAEDLGIDPGHELTAARDHVLRVPEQRAIDASETGVTRPAQLPADLPTFTGRRSELAQVLALGATEASARTVVISAIGGMAGIGKTTLAVHWAHQVADGFPDGQLYLNLRGFDPSGQVMTPTDALQTMLGALGVDARQIPGALDAQSALYRSRLAGRRMLILLDNARDTHQVRPLLPGGGGCLVIVTSRNQLTGLVAGDAAHPLSLGLLSPADAVDFLSRRLGADRVAAEPSTIAQLVDLCAGLPLALAIVAARAVTHPSFPLASIANEVADADGSLDAFEGPEADVNARAVFSWSYQALSPAAARMFRLLGVHPGPDISGPAAASLVGAARSEARGHLAELTRANLISEHSPGRYNLHDLLRAYASELAATDGEEAQAARRRLLDHYLHTAHPASPLISTARKPITLVEMDDGVTPERIDDMERAYAWFTAEDRILIAAVSFAAAHGFDHHTSQLQWSISPFLNRRRSPQIEIDLMIVAIGAVDRLNDRPMKARMLHGLGLAHLRSGDFNPAHRCLAEALDLLIDLGDVIGQSRMHSVMCAAFGEQGRLPEALHHAHEAHRLIEPTGDRYETSIALVAIAGIYLDLGDTHQAMHYGQLSLQSERDLGFPSAGAMPWQCIGRGHHLLGEYSEAIDSFDKAITLYGADSQRAQALEWLGDTRAAMGDRNAARAAWQSALDVLNESSTHRSAAIARKLHDA